MPADRRETPIACTLNQGDLLDRRAVWERLAATALTELHAMSDGVRLVYTASDDVEAQLRELVRLEADCCSFAMWRVASQGERIVLDVSAPGGGADAVRALFGAPASASTTTAV